MVSENTSQFDACHGYRAVYQAPAQKPKWTKYFSAAWGVVCLVGLTLLLPGVSEAQRSLPGTDYFRSFGEFYRADYRSAFRDFERGAGSSAYRKGQERFLDSVCYWTMMGECHYHAGNYADALAMYEQSLQHYLTYAKIRWQDRVRSAPPAQRDPQAIDRAQIGWYKPRRTVRKARMPDDFAVLFGRLDAARAYEEGGVYDPAEFRNINVTEIMRCVGLAIHRRRVIRGPTCKHDPFSTDLVNGLSSASKNSRTLLGAYNGVLLGLAEASMENWAAAAKRLKASISYDTGFDHPLTPVAYLELAHITAALGNDALASQLAMEASYSAGLFDQYDLVEESLTLATMLHLKLNGGPFPPLNNAIAWAERRRVSLLTASLQVRLAECFAEVGDSAAAANVLQQAKRAVTRGGVADSVVASRYQYVSALTRLQAGDEEGGRADLASALNVDGNGALGRFRLRLTDQLSASGVIGERQSDLLYGVLLRDPTADEWKMDPFEAMSSLVFPRVESLERWFEIVVSRKDFSRAIEVAEQLRRYRFYAQLPLSGRLLSFRWMLHGPSEALSKEAIAQRTTFLIDHPVYQDLTRQAESAVRELKALPLTPDPKSDQAKKQIEWFRKLSGASDAQEAYLSSVALRREPAEMIFPAPVRIRNLAQVDQIWAAGSGGCCYRPQLSHAAGG